MFSHDLSQSSIQFLNYNPVPTSTNETGFDQAQIGEKMGPVVQNIDDQFDEQEILKKKTQNKMRYRKLKHKLLSLCQTLPEKCLTKENKEISSPNKSRLLTLGIQFQKITLHQTRDYIALEGKLKQIYKILDHKREHDLLILKQSRFLPAISSLLKKLPAFHKNQYNQSLKTIDLGLRILRIFCTVSSNRDYMISTNQLSILNACLGCFLGKQEKKMCIYCLQILHELLCSRIKAQLEQIVSLTLEIIFLGQLGKKIRLGLESCITEDGIVDEQFILKCLKYWYLIYEKLFEKALQKPIYNQGTLAYYYQNNIDLMVIFLQNLLISVVLDRDGSLREEQLSISAINISLYVLRILNFSLHICVEFTKKIIEINAKSNFVRTILHIFEYSKENFDNGTGLHQLNCICSEVMVLIGKLAYDSEENKNLLRETGLLQSLYNYPFAYFMDEKLKSLLIPSLCSVMEGNKVNMKKYLCECSSDGIIQFVEEEIKAYEKQEQVITEQKQEKQIISMPTMTRKGSVSSLNSFKTECTQNSYKALSFQECKNKYENILKKILPFWKWNQFMEELKSLDV